MVHGVVSKAALGYQLYFWFTGTQWRQRLPNLRWRNRLYFRFTGTQRKERKTVATTKHSGNNDTQWKQREATLQ